MRDNTTPERRYTQHRQSAQRRGIDFLLTYSEWWALWAPHWHRRGQKAQDMCMCRKADQGAYAVGNVRIATNKENQQERALEFRTKHAQRRYRYTTKNEYTSVGAAPLDWTVGRNAFAEYAENEEENA